MPLTDAQKKAQKKYYEKNREKILAYKSTYWQLNKHKWIGTKNVKSTDFVIDSEDIKPECVEKN